MARRIFISYQHRDHGKAHGLNLMSYNKHLKIDVSCRHLLNPVNSVDPGYISRKIKEQIKNTSVTVVLVGKDTHQSEWVKKEIEWSLEKGNRIVAIRLDSTSPLPDGIDESGAEILDWHKPEDVHQFGAAIERAAAASRMSVTTGASQAGGCSR